MVTTVTKKSAISTDVFMPKLTLTLTFSNGKEIIVNANELRQDIRDMAMIAGLKAKLIDAAAMSRNPENGASASVDDKFNAVKKVADRLMSEDGQWNEGRSAAGEGATSGANNILLRAMMRMTGHDEAYVRAFLENKTKEERAALRKNPRVAAIIVELQSATVVGGINTDALLGELGVVHETETSAPVETSAPTPPTAKPNTRSSKKKLLTTTEE